VVRWVDAVMTYAVSAAQPRTTAQIRSVYDAVILFRDVTRNEKIYNRCLAGKFNRR
jgi:hypothetical protein